MSYKECALTSMAEPSASNSTSKPWFVASSSSSPFHSFVDMSRGSPIALLSALSLSFSSALAAIAVTADLDLTTSGATVDLAAQLTNTVDLTISNADIAPDGYTRAAIVVNGQRYPGPLLTGNKVRLPHALCFSISN